jgi:hypothetical protein
MSRKDYYLFADILGSAFRQSGKSDVNTILNMIMERFIEFAKKDNQDLTLRNSGMQWRIINQRKYEIQWIRIQGSY